MQILSLTTHSLSISGKKKTKRSLIDRGSPRQRAEIFYTTAKNDDVRSGPRNFARSLEERKKKKKKRKSALNFEVVVLRSTARYSVIL